MAKRAFQSANRPKSGTFISPSSVVPSLTTPAPATTGVFKEGPASNAPIGLSRTEPRITQKDDQATQPARRIPSTIDAAAGPSRHPGAIAQATSTTTASKGKAPQIISSLFTSNPTYKPTKQGVEAVPGAPSNAPLRGNTDTFAGLGLDPLLVNHMKQKTGLKAPTAIQRSALPALLSAPLNIDSPPAEYDNGGIPTNSPSNGLPSEHDPAQASVRDALIQSQTGSGKTLTYLLPIIQTLLPLSQLSYIDRSIGTLAIILAPTRELAQQIEKVLESLLSMSLSLPDSSNDTHYTRWLVSGLLTGGATKTHEKARLRKGVPILVATPGRLLDHLQNTSSFQCGKTLFLVLDEADRLMDLGFEETITGIIKALDGRRKLAVAAEKELDELGGGSMRWPFWGRGRQTILCSATVDAKVEKLAGMTLRDPIIFRATEMDVSEDVVTKSTGSFNKHDQILERLAAAASSTIELPKTLGPDKFTPPSQLTQKYVVVPSKLRLVTLVALLRSLTSSMDNAETNKVIVFLTSTDTVDFHWRMMGGVQMGETATVESPGSDVVTLQSPLLPKSNIQRLHGSLPLAIRRSSLASFASPSESPSILLATSVASRGLDLPLVKSVIQYELPTEGGTNEYVHRVGRTARAGKGGEAWAFVGPAEAAWVPWVEGRMGTVKDESGRNTTVKLREVPVEDVLRKGFGGKGYEFEARATDVQLSFERWVLSSEQVGLVGAGVQDANLVAEHHFGQESLCLIHAGVLDPSCRRESLLPP